MKYRQVKWLYPIFCLQWYSVRHTHNQSQIEWFIDCLFDERFMILAFSIKWRIIGHVYDIGRILLLVSSTPCVHEKIQVVNTVLLIGEFQFSIYFLFICIEHCYSNKPLIHRKISLHWNKNNPDERGDLSLPVTKPLITGKSSIISMWGMPSNDFESPHFAAGSVSFPCGLAKEMSRWRFPLDGLFAFSLFSKTHQNGVDFTRHTLHFDITSSITEASSIWDLC